MFPMRSLLNLCAAALVTFPMAGMAANDLPLGSFSHGAADPAWTVQPAGNGYQATSHQQGDVQPVFELTEAGRKSLWERMQWPAETAATARCLGNMLDVFCHVGPDAAQRIDALHTAQATDFHYDRANGVVAIHPVKR